MLEFLTRHKTTMPSAGEALPGRDTPIVTPGDHAVLGTPMAPPFPEDTDAWSSGWAASGAPSDRSGSCPASHHGRRLRRRASRRTPPTRRSAPGAPATTRWCSWSSGPAEISLEEILRNVLGGPRPDPGDAPGQRRRHPVPLGHLHDRATPSARPRWPRATPTQKALAGGRASGEITTEIARRAASSTTPRTTTSSTWPRTRTATAASAARASPARSG